MRRHLYRILLNPANIVCRDIPAPPNALTLLARVDGIPKQRSPISTSGMRSVSFLKAQSDVSESVLHDVSMHMQRN